MSSNRFEEIYANDEWGGGSGEGSLDIHTKGYRVFLQNFMAQKNISSVVDVGCGDWQFSRFIDWSKVRYAGYDVVPSVITNNTRNFSTRNISFNLYSGNPNDLPEADLLIAKDVLQHLPNKTVSDFVACLPKYRFALLTNCVNPRGKTTNNDITLGDFRYLDLRLPPIDLPAEQIYSFEKNEPDVLRKLRRVIRRYPTWKKIVLMVDNSNPHS